MYKGKRNIIKMKRSTSVALCTRSKKPKLEDGISVINRTKYWVAATHIYNYMINDPIVDWLKLTSRCSSKKYTNFLIEHGIKFETEIVKYINDNIIPVKTVSKYINAESCQKTIDLMLDGAPIIHSAPVKNRKNNTEGIIDLLIRSDYIEYLVSESPITDNEKHISAPKLGKNFHYVVADIKYSTLPLRSDQCHILNSGNYPAYKGQLWIYNQAISEIQGYLPRYSFIMGRRSKYTANGISNIEYDCLVKLGVVDFEGVDKEYIQKTKKAIQWIRDVNEYGREWKIYPPSRQELYPNMSVDSGIWNKQKEKISDKIGEITSIWNCGVKNRKIALLNNIKSWKDPDCNSFNIGINGSRAGIIDKILSINRQNKDKIWPEKLETDISKIGEEMFVDFETLSDVFSNFTNLPRQNPMGMIFMIGAGFIEDGKWVYKSFICSEPTYKEEYRIMNEFSQLVKKKNNPQLHYWHAEKSFWKSAECRQFDISTDSEIKNNISDNWKEFEWNDLCSLFKSEPIVLKGCFKFGLKSIAKTMREHKMITSYNDSSCDTGMIATNKAWEYYQKADREIAFDELKDIEKYNEFDCRVLSDILYYLRKNHV